jgi:YaiO family outer membrane protein
MCARSTAIALVLVLGVASPGVAQVGETPRPTLQFGVAYEALSHDLDPWRSANLDLSGSPNRMQTVYGAIRETTRFSRLDHEVMGGFRQRVSPRLTLVVEGQVSPSHHVAPKWDALGQVEAVAQGGWNVQAGLRHRKYESTSVNLGAMTIERYWGRYRGAYTLYVSHLADAGLSASHRVHGDYYYDRLSSSIGLSFATGRELENVGPRGVLRTDVRSAALVGRQWLTPSWFVRYDVLVHEQGVLYTRTRVSASLGHRF